MTNNLNQYLQVGSDVRTYDTDGNLKTDAAGGATYAYDDENRLISVADASGSVQYEYDALGNRIARVEGGARIEYLPDPTGLTNVVAEYDASGNVIARYVHGGFGLVSRHDAGGSVAFYDHDALGSTAALTASDGSAMNTYSYLPFGEPLAHSESVPNPFEYVGQFGVQRDGNGLDFMRARYYSSDDGRFINEDPIGVLGGMNLYRYASNEPTGLIDPLGLTGFPHWFVSLTIDAIEGVAAREVAAIEAQALVLEAEAAAAARALPSVIVAEEAGTTIAASGRAVLLRGFITPQLLRFNVLTGLLWFAYYAYENDFGNESIAKGGIGDLLCDSSTATNPISASPPLLAIRSTTARRARSRRATPTTSSVPLASVRSSSSGKRRRSRT